MKKQISITLAFLFMFCSAAKADVIDFETADEGIFTSQINIEGFEFNFGAAGWWIGPGTDAFHPDGTSNGTSNLVAAGQRANVAAHVIMNEMLGESFDIFSLDAATANILENNTLMIHGITSMGDDVFANLNIDGGFTNHMLVGFTDLVSVTFSSLNIAEYNFGGFSIDNIALTDGNMHVPAPGMVLLFALGAALISFRKQAKSRSGW